VRTPLGPHRVPVRVVQEEVPLQLGTETVPRQTRRTSLLTRQKLDRHNNSPKIDNSDPRWLCQEITPGQSTN
jgi:hypothetical protein